MPSREKEDRDFERQRRDKHVKTNTCPERDRWWAIGLHLKDKLCLRMGMLPEILFLLIFPLPRDWDYLYAKAMLFKWNVNAQLIKQIDT